MRCKNIYQVLDELQKRGIISRADCYNRKALLNMGMRGSAVRDLMYAGHYTVDEEHEEYVVGQ